MSFFKKNNSQNLSIQEVFLKSEDFKQIQFVNEKTNKPFTLTYFSTLIDEKIFQENILSYLQNREFHTFEDIKKILPIQEVELIDDNKKLEEKLLNGDILLTFEAFKDEVLSIPCKKEYTRSMSVPEVEFSVVGPKEAFVESINQNINLIRKRLPIKELIIKEYEVGKLSKTRVAVLHIEGLTNEEDVKTIRQRIENIDFDHLNDSSYIEQIIADNTNSPFPQFLDTERPDRVTSILAQGKIAVLVDGSPHALIAPTTLVEFFGAFEDYFLNWMISSFFRLLRLFAVTFSILVTPMYVAVLTYHYEIIPQDLIGILVASRRQIPFPPILEVLILETTIELLREAGARLPTKVGQTIGIVGGIVIGTASVEAGLTSNVLLIFIALAALASFTTPVYKIGNTIRLMRFPFIILADIWGLLGIAIAFCVLLTHLLRLTSLGRPYLEPIYPLRISDFKDSIIRLPFYKQSKRPLYSRTNNVNRFSSNEAQKKKDIDE